MTSKSKVMGNLGSADGCILRCLDILENTSHSLDGLTEIISKLQRAHEAILVAAKEIEGKGEDL